MPAGLLKEKGFEGLTTGVSALNCKRGKWAFAFEFQDSNSTNNMTELQTQKET